MSFKYKVLPRIVEAAIGLVALVIGGLIYIRYRNESLLMFDWFQELRISNIIGEFRDDADKSNVYEWVKYNMPAGLYDFMDFFSYILAILMFIIIKKL